MKNLRKVLAVVLVICMAFSLMAVASAKSDFSDQASITQKEAVDLVSGLGIMVGSGGTGFEPTGTFTREMAAKVICYILLGKTISEALTTSTTSFKDVAVTRWSAPYIEYGVSSGIIAGMGDGTFAPTSPVTGSQFAKMLLVALGYGAKGEFTGASWEINAIVKAQSIGILDTGVNYSAAATREQVAKYVFNVLTKISCHTTNYNVVTGTYSVPETDAAKLAATLGKLTFSLTEKQSDPEALAGKFYPFIEAHYWNAFVPSVTVTGVYGDDNVLLTSTNGAALTGDKGLTTVSATNTFYKVALDTDYVVYYNGMLQDGGTAAAVDAAYATKAGTVIQLIDNGLNGKADVISVISKTSALLSVTPSVAAVTGTVSWTGVGAGSFLKGELVYPAGLAVNDVVSYVKYGDVSPITYAEKDTKVTGQMTAGTAAKITFAGTAYTLAGTPGVSFFTNAANNPATATNYNKAATAWIDSNGYMVYIAKDVATVTYTYGLVVGYSYTAGNSFADASAKVRLYTADGVVKVYDVAADKTSKVVEDQNFDLTNATLVSYVIGSDGKVTLTEVGTPDTIGNAGYAKKSPTIAIENGATDTINFITASTQVIYFNTADPYSAVTNVASFVTGYSSTAAADAGTAVTYVLAKDAAGNDTNKLAVILVSQAPAAATSSNYGYLVSTSYTTKFVDGTPYYDYTLYVNGAATTVTADDNGYFTATGLYSYDVANNTVTGASLKAGVTDGTVSLVEAGYIYYTSGTTPTAVAVTSATKYFMVTPGVTVAETGVFTLSGATTTAISHIVMDVTNTSATAIYYTVAPAT